MAKIERPTLETKRLNWFVAVSVREIPLFKIKKKKKNP